MNLVRAFVLTLGYILIIELVAFWIWVAEYFNIEYYNSYLLIQGIFQFIVILLILKVLKSETISEQFRKTDFKWYLAAFIIGSTYVYVQLPLKLFYNLLFKTNYYITYDFNGLTNFWSASILSTVFFIPISEELFFRGFIQQQLQGRMKGFQAIIISSLMFGLIHLLVFRITPIGLGFNWHLFYLTFVGGLIAGYLFYKSKSIVPPIIFHICWNAMVFVT